MELKSERIDVADAWEAVELYFERRWTDGLAIVPPTEERVERMIRYSGRDPQEILGEVPPYYGIATIEKLAVNAVMAGCLPEYFPVVIAAMEAMLEPRHNLNGTQCTQSGAEPLIIVNGPIVKRLGVNFAESVFGRGYRANGTIGRAVRLALWNLGRNFPGEPDRSTTSHPGSWSYCIAEDEERSPWEPLHVEKGLPKGSDAVTVFCCEAPHPVAVHGTVKQVLQGLCDAIATPGAANYVFLGDGAELLVTISPLNVARFREEGWSKQDVKHYLWDHSKVPYHRIKQLGILTAVEMGGSDFAEFRWPKWIDKSDPNYPVPATLSPDDVHVVVCGGNGDWCTVCHGWGYGGVAITKEIKAPRG